MAFTSLPYLVRDAAAVILAPPRRGSRQRRGKPPHLRLRRLRFYPAYCDLTFVHAASMADTLDQRARSERMSRIRGKDTKPEMIIRHLVHRMGFRYRLHQKNLPGCPDMVFPRLRKVILIHGCFWHRHPDPGCRLARLPKSRLEFWGPKLAANRDRDERQRLALEALGWAVLVVWECELGYKEQLENKLRSFLSGGLCGPSNFSRELEDSGLA